MDMTKTYQPGEAASEWMKQWRELNDQAKVEILDGLRKLGYTIEAKA